MALSPGTRLGPYESVARLGAGGMGEVYRARDTRLGREVAIKVLPGELSSNRERLSRFEKEARSASALNHPNIVTVHEIGESDSRSYIVMELVDGATLREVLASGPLPIRRLVDIAAHVADGMAKAHASGIVHRDLKPENVMVTKEGLVKILDFGLAKLTQPDLPGGPLTQTPTISAGTEPGVVLGTVGYMSPEQAGGKAVDFRSDQFSFGSMLYEMATGERAFRRDTTVDTLSSILHDEPEPIGQSNPKTPAPFRWIVERCLAKDPGERYESSRDLARDLRAVRDHLSETTISGESPLAPRARPRSALRPVLAGLVLIVAAAIGFYAARPFWKTPATSVPRYHQLTFRRGTIFSARFAPDGQTIVYGAAWEGRPIELFSCRSDSPESRSLGLPEADIFGISSSGDIALSLGHRFVFGDENNGTLARVPLAGGAPREVLEKVQWADWASDGVRLAIVRDVGGRNRLEFPIGKVLYQTAGWISHPRISPRGDLIAFLDHPVRDDDRGSVAVVDLSGKMRVLCSGWTTEEGLAWSTAGDEVWFSATRTGSARALQAVTLSGRLPLVANVTGTLTLHDISGDGRILLAHDNSRFGIIGLSPGETKERDLSWLDWSLAADLSTDGRTLLSGEDGEGGGANYAVYLRKMDGSLAVRLGGGSCLRVSPL